MRAKHSCVLFSIFKLILLPLLIILFVPLLIFFSFHVDSSLYTDQYLYWFILCSKGFYIILFLVSTMKLYSIISTLCHKTIISKRSASDALGRETVTEHSIKTKVNLTNQPILDLENLNSKNEHYKEKDICLSQDCCYENIPLPVLCTSEDGIVIGYNKMSKDFFGINLNNRNISDFIEFLNVYTLKSCNIINIKLHIAKNNEFITSIFQKSILDNNQKLQSVVLIFLPGYIHNSLIEHCNSYKSKKSNIYNNPLNNFSSDLCKNLSITEITDVLNLGLIIIQKDKIFLVNNKAIELLNTVYKYKQSKNIYKNHYVNSNYNKLKYSKGTLIGNSFKKIFVDLLDHKQILNILDTSQGINKLEFQDLLYLDIHHILLNKYIILTLVNTTEIRKLELQNTFSQRLQTIGQIASAVAHDFNNLLTAIMSFTYFLKERYGEEDPSSLELEQIAQNSNRAKVMIRQLLTFSRSKELNPVDFLVNSEISNLMSTILRLMGERIKTEFVRGKNIGRITMDPVQFQQVIINLVVNARDSMKKGGKLSISTNLVNLKTPQESVIATIPPGKYIVISIKDQGEGIKKENFKKVFQTHFSTKGDKGNGLGLSTVAKIMQENSGFIDLESTINQGTSFHLYFSASKAHNSTDDSKEEMLTLQNNQDITIDLTGSGTILLVEDEVPVRTVCKRALVNKGYQVIEAEDAETALTLLQNSTNKVDLVISDVMMPGISGLEFISEAKKIKPNLKAILMSGYAEDTLEYKHYTLDFIEFLAKPFSPDVLATKVKKVITS